MSADARPRVAVIIPCYNGERFVGEAIESVLAQSHPVAEIFFVDDGSTDQSATIAKSFKGVRCIEQGNLGVNAARNAGLAASTSELVLFLDADDRLRTDAIANQVTALESHPDWALVSGEVRIIAENSSFVREPRSIRFDGEPYIQLLRANYIWTPGAVLYRREVLEEIGGFSGWAGASADYEINLRIARQFSIGRIDRPVVDYRVHNQNMSGNMRNMLKSDVTVRRRERCHALRSAEAKRAWQQGFAEMRKDYGGKLFARMKSEMRTRQFGEALVSASYLIRYAPWMLKRLLRAALKRAPSLGRSGH